jgi:hypothetical protein
MSVTLPLTDDGRRLASGTTGGAERLLRPFLDLYHRQPQLTAAAAISLVAILPCLMAMLVDTRTVNDISAWVKPTKFLVSFVVYYATLAWAFGYLPQERQSSRAGRFVIRGAIVVGLLEMTWLLLAAANGVPAHFNSSSVLWQAAYGLAGVGSVILITAILVQGVMIARQRSIRIAPELRLALVTGAVVAFAGTLVAAGYLSAGDGHWVGGARSDAAGLALMGWSRTGGDLRVAHFWSLHAQQFIPAIGWIFATLRLPYARTGVALASAAYVGLIAFTFVQALQGRPFLPSLG